MVLSSRAFNWLYAAAIFAATVSAQNGTEPIPHPEDPVEPNPFPGRDFEWPPNFGKVRWDNITTEEDKLSWVPCDFLNGVEGLQCGKLAVPLDWKNQSAVYNNSNTHSLALVKYPPQLPLGEQDPGWKGPLFVNFGGPGGAGTVNLVMAMDAWYTIFGGNFSIISWDPRGVGYTRPAAKCFLEYRPQVIFTRDHFEQIPLDKQSTQAAFRLGKAYSEICQQQLEGLGQYVGTAATARDLLRMSDLAWAEGGKKGKKGVQYLGMSYGSILGMTFATMFPDRVEKMFLDGIAGAEDYYSGDRGDLYDLEPLVELFYKTCAEAGKKCKLNDTGNLSARRIKDRVHRLLKSLREDGPRAYRNSRRTIHLFSEATLRNLLYYKNMAPHMDFERLANIISQVEKIELSGNSLTNMFLMEGNEFPMDIDVDIPDYIEEMNNQALPAIACGDGKLHPTYTFRDYEEDVRRLVKMAPTNGQVYASQHSFCADWKIQASEIVNQMGAKLKKPIVFATTLLDPRTPNRNAKLHSRQFSNSVVREYSGYGHGSVTFRCGMSDILNYFNDGVLPKKGEVCQVEDDEKPFGGLDYVSMMDPFGNTPYGLNDGEVPLEDIEPIVGNNTVGGLPPSSKLKKRKFGDAEGEAAVKIRKALRFASSGPGLY